MATEAELFSQIDALLAAAQADPDRANELVKEATRLLQQVREQREIAALPAHLRYLYGQMENVQ